MSIFRKNVVPRVWRCEIVRRGSLYPEIVTVEAETKRTARAALSRKLGPNAQYKLLYIITEN